MEAAHLLLLFRRKKRKVESFLMGQNVEDWTYVNLVFVGRA